MTATADPLANAEIALAEHLAEVQGEYNHDSENCNTCVLLEKDVDNARVGEIERDEEEDFIGPIVSYRIHTGEPDGYSHVAFLRPLTSKSERTVIENYACNIDEACGVRPMIVDAWGDICPSNPLFERIWFPQF